MNFLQELYANPVVHSIGWTLLHACWQITLVALLLKLVLKSAEKYTSNLAYSLAVFSLVAICIWSGYTFTQQYDHFEQAIQLAPLEAEVKTENQITIATKTNRYFTKPKEEIITPSWNDRLYQFERYLPILVIFWLVGTLLLILRFLGGWLQIRRLKTKALSPVETFWLDRLEELKLKIGVHQNIGFFSSALVNEPVTMGHFKPIILVPLGMFANLTPDMVEALLLHELAHIKRSDYLVNIVQTLLEIIFFFHPAIWWISQNIRQIREHACDDMAVKACQNPLLYAKTLTHIQSSFLSSKNILAMSATGKTGNFTTRIKRLFGYTESSPRSKKSLAFSSLLFTGLLLFAFTNPLEKTVNNSGFPEQITASEAMLFVITPSTTQKQLDKIKSAFAEENVTVEFTNISYSPFGLIEEIRAAFDVPDKGHTMIHIDKLINITVSLDWNRENPIDVRGSGEKRSIVLPSEGKPESHVTNPYINTFDKPSMIGGIGFKKDKNNKAVLTADLPDDKTHIILNGEIIQKDALNAKKLKPSDVHSLLRFTAEQFGKKYDIATDWDAYEIYTKDKKKKTAWWPFEKDTDPDDKLTQHTFKVLHKAEVRELNQAPGIIGIEGGSITVSASSCDDDKEGYHVLNDQFLEVPEGHCYPPTIRALTEVDSIFLLGERLSFEMFGVKSATLSDNNFDIMIMRNVKFNMTSEADAPLCFLNDERLESTKTGDWPNAILEIPQFDSLILITGQTALDRYGEEGKNDVWFFYKDNSAQESFPKLLESNKSQDKSNMLYVVDGQIVFPEGDEEVPASVEALYPEKIQEVVILKNDVAIKKYGNIGKDGVMEITTNASSTGWNLEETFKVTPNPVHQLAKVAFTLLDRRQVTITIYDQQGTEITTLANRTMNKGIHEITWEPSDIPSGIYYVNLRVDDGNYTKSIVVQKGL